MKVLVVILLVYAGGWKHGGLTSIPVESLVKCEQLKKEILKDFAGENFKAECYVTHEDN